VNYVLALAAEFEKLGGVIVEDCRVHAAENNDPVVMQTSRGEMRSKYLIYATHIPPGVSLLNLRCAPYRSYAMAFTLADNSYPAELLYDMYDPYHYFRTQEVNGQKYLIAGGEDHKTAHEENTEACFRNLEAHVRKHYNINTVEYQWSSQYFEPVDGLPYIGHMPGQPGRILVASGFGGNGMIYSHVAARVLTDLIQQKETEYTKLFNPNRIKPIAGFTNFIKENADVVVQFFKKMASKEELTALADMAPGEGRLVEYEGDKIALYKDVDGSLHAVKPTCTHMKCSVAWNGAEKSWDCPCHGARYDVDGRVLTGPADKDLATYDFEQPAVKEREGSHSH
jgi:Rieske Fe-S protein